MFELYHKAIKKARVFLAKPGFFLFFYVLIELSKWQTRESPGPGGNEPLYAKLLTNDPDCVINRESAYSRTILYGGPNMKRITTLETRNLCESAKNGGCGECQTSCQSACKTSCGVANQQCEKTAKKA